MTDAHSQSLHREPQDFCYGPKDQWYSGRALTLRTDDSDGTYMLSGYSNCSAAAKTVWLHLFVKKKERQKTRSEYSSGIQKTVQNVHSCTFGCNNIHNSKQN